VILHFTDPHFNKNAFAFIAKMAASFCADVCISGDFLDVRRTETHPLSEQIAWVQTWMREQPFKLFLCSGNHDPDADEDPFTASWLRGLHNGETVFTDGHRGKGSDGEIIGCVPYGYVFPPHEGIFENVDVLLFHEPPFGSDTATIGGCDNGSMDIADFLSGEIRAPRVLLSGHVHRPRRPMCRYADTVVVNPGSCDTEGKFPFASIKVPLGSAEPVVSFLLGEG
jgi:Icc-related predicted phosphoesterase